MTWEIEFLEREGHVAITSLNNGLLALFSDFPIPEDKKDGGLEAVVSHYRKLTTQYGFENEPPEEALFNLAYRQKQKKELEKSIVSFQTLLNIYPFSWRAHFSLAETFAETGKMMSARSHYEKALEINPGFEAAKKRLLENRAPISATFR